MYVFVCVYICIFLFTYACTFMYIYVNDVCICMCVYMHISFYIRIHIYVNICKRCMYLYVCIYAYFLLHINTYTFIHIHIYTHICMNVHARHNDIPWCNHLYPHACIHTACVACALIEDDSSARGGGGGGTSAVEAAAIRIRRERGREGNTCMFTLRNGRTSSIGILHHLCDMSHSYVWHDSFICVTWLTHPLRWPHSLNWGGVWVMSNICDRTLPYVRRDSFTFRGGCTPFRGEVYRPYDTASVVMYTGDITHMSRDSSIFVTWLVHCVYWSCYARVTRLWWCVWIIWHNFSGDVYGSHHSYVTWLIHICDVTRAPWVWVMSHACDMTHSYVWHDWCTYILRWPHSLNGWCGWVMSHTSVGAMLHTCMGHVTRMNESCHTYEWVMSHLWMSHVTHMNESCHTYERVMTHIWMSHVTRVNGSCHTCEWVMSHLWIVHVTRMNESCHTYEWVMSHPWMSHVTPMNESCHTWMSHVTRMNEPCHTYECVMSHMQIGHVPHMSEARHTENMFHI